MTYQEVMEFWQAKKPTRAGKTVWQMIENAIGKQIKKKPKHTKIEYGKHKWRRKENGEIDEDAWDYGYHSGVVCEQCGETYCVHCEPDYQELNDCVVDEYICPNCNKDPIFKLACCDKCGQALDWSDCE